MSEKRAHVITYPGFAEGKDAKRLYTDLKDIYSDHYDFHILPFYEEISGGDRVIHSIRRHANDIQAYMDDLDGEVSMLAKCGGTRPTITMDDEHISRLSRLCLINPPYKVSNRFLAYQFQSWGGSEKTDGSWTIPRGDTGHYIVTKEYLNDATTTDMMGRFKDITRKDLTKLFIVRSLSDEVLPPIQVEKIAGAIPIDIEGGNHHLTGESRAKAIAALALHGVL